LVSLVIVLVLLGVTVTGAIRTVQAAASTSDSVNLTLAAQGLIHQAQRERGLSVGLLGGNQQFRPALDAQRAQTDLALADIHRRVDHSDDPGTGAVRTALGKFDDLPAIRSGVDHGQARRDETFQRFTDAIAAVNTLDLGFDQVSDVALQHGLLALRALGDAKEDTGQERAILSGVFAAGQFTGDEYLQFTQIRAGKLAALDQFRRQGTADEQARLDTALRSPAAVEAAGHETTALGGATGRLPAQVDSLTWFNTMTRVIDDMRGVQLNVGDDILGRVADIRGSATWELVVFLLLAVIAAAAEAALVAGAVRSITRPLAALAEEAEAVAAARLPGAIASVQEARQTPAPPAPLRVSPNAAAEIHLVTAALDGVQQTAFELAAEQAVLRQNTVESMSNLGRRNQNLVRRQLRLISRFEADELDPDALGRLFELDHLATRMRRNAESLLVLAGEASPRRVDQPVPIIDVMRAALSEVEDYRRVVPRRVADAWVGGMFATDLTHILAELLENALSFSPPEAEVEIYGRDTAAGYLVAVVDHGVGMPPDALAEANDRLSGQGQFMVAPTRFLGHYVVGKLAARLAVKAQLLESPSRGITARLSLPAQILMPPPTRFAEQTTELQPDNGHPLPAPNPVPHEIPQQPEAESGRTRNGLVLPAQAPPEPGDHHEQPAKSRSPQEAGALLSAFRAGHERGRHRAPVMTPPADQPSREEQPQ
jgi:signal transduction histidine kinase